MAMALTEVTTLEQLEKFARTFEGHQALTQGYLAGQAELKFPRSTFKTPLVRAISTIEESEMRKLPMPVQAMILRGFEFALSELSLEELLAAHK